MIFNEIDVNVPGLESVFEPPSTSATAYIYHDVEHDRVSSSDVIGHEVLHDDDPHVRLEIRQNVEPAIGQEYVYEFAHGNTKAKSMVCEDAEKRRVRRERNKLAASKCRKKRKDHVKNLIESYEQLEVCNKNLETEIEKLHSEIRELEKMLDTHACTKLLYAESGNDVLS